jgi:hypothetical protein
VGGTGARYLGTIMLLNREAGMSTSTQLPAEEFPGWSRAKALRLRQVGVAAWLEQDTGVRNSAAGLGKWTRLHV